MGSMFGKYFSNDLNKNVSQIALDEAGEDAISFFISDAIYDIQQKDNPLQALVC